MKVAYKIVGAAGWFTLFDVVQGALLGVPDVMPEYKVRLRMANFKAPGFGSGSQSINPEGNALVTLSWKFEASYTATGGISALQVALASTRVMQQTFAGVNVHLQVIQDGETHYYPNGCMDDYEGDAQGAKVMHSFTFTTQAVTSTAPTT